MIGVTVVAIVLSSISTWRYLSLARIEWLAPSSAAARQLWTEPVVAKRGVDFTAVFTPKFRDVSDLYAIEVQTKPAWQGSFGRQVDHPRQTIRLESSHQPRLEETLSAMAKSDLPKKGWFAIRGMVEDREGRPVADAMVDLMGSYVYVNHFQTRPDGTFTMPIQAPPGRGYYFRVRYGGNRRMKTDRFALTDGNRELVARIRVK